MKREIKQAMSGIGLIGSFIAILFLVKFEEASSNGSYGIVVILLVVIFLLSAAAFITYSKTGWSNVSTAFLLGPSALLFQNRNSGEQSRKEARMDQKKDEEYYKMR